MDGNLLVSFVYVQKMPLISIRLHKNVAFFVNQPHTNCSPEVYL